MKLLHKCETIDTQKSYVYRKGACICIIFSNAMSYAISHPFDVRPNYISGEKIPYYTQYRL